MTPQLQQAIRLLQLSSMELQTEIQDVLDSNMMLELDEEEFASLGPADEKAPLPADSDPEIYDSKDNMDKNDIPVDLPVDSAWEDIYDGNISYASQPDRADYYSIENQNSPEKTLRDHLLWQLNLAPTSETDKALAIAIIDALDDDGYLKSSLEDLCRILSEDLESEIEIDEIEAVLSLVQAMDPAGIAARDLRECLCLQLAQYGPETEWLAEAKELAGKHLQILASHDYNQLMRRMKLNREQLAQVIALIQSLNPRPGSQVQESEIQYIIPDVYVKKINGAWKIDLNADAIPRLRINSGYAGMIKRADSSADNTSLKSHLQEARWFIKSLQSRSETLLRVANAIVERQRAFLDYGEEAMKPLVLHDIAEELALHESTISRVTTRKYMHTPRGIFELKYFFSSHVSTDFGGACSSTAIRALIKKLITAEKPQRPLSDSKIAAILADQGIRVARRTIAKYREAMTIPPSNERKRLA